MKFLRKTFTLLILTQMIHFPACFAGDLYSDQANPLTSIIPDAVIQGDAGTCYLLAPLASLAEINPQVIYDMIKTNFDGSYTVTFPGAPDEPITVTLTADDEKFAKTYRGDWVAVIEKAYGVYCSRHFWRRFFTDIFETEPSAQSAGGGSCLEAGLKILTGSDVRTDFLSFTRYSTIDKQLTSAFDEKRPVTASTALVSHAGLPTRHEFSVLAYQPNKDDLKSGLITIRNPWGHTGPVRADGSQEGASFTMTLEDFCSDFTWLAYALNAPKPSQTVADQPHDSSSQPPEKEGYKWDPIAGIYYRPEDQVARPVAQETVPSTSVVIETRPDGSKISTMADGTKIFEFDTGLIYIGFPDRTRYWQYPSGNQVTVKPDKTEITEFPSGRRVTEKPDGTKIYDGAGGYEITIDPEGHRTVVKPNGETLQNALSSLNDLGVDTGSAGDSQALAELPDATNKEPSSQMAAREATRFEEEVKSGLVTCQLTGDGHTSSHCSLVLSNTTGTVQKVAIPAYESFVPAEHGLQVMMLRERQSFTLPAGGEVKADVPTFCVSSKSLQAPGSKDIKYQPGRYPDVREFRTIVGIIEAGKKLSTSAEYSIVPIAPERRAETLTQLAIWKELAPRSGRADDLVTREGLLKSVCEQAGVDPTTLSRKEQKGLDSRIDALFSAVDLTCKEGGELSRCQSLALRNK